VKAQIVVVAKEPVPGRVKTRLCPPCSPRLAARIADAALRDTLEAVTRAEAARRVLLLDGDYQAPPGWEVTAQQGDGLAQRLANGLVATAREGLATLLIGMDTPQVTPSLLSTVVDGLSSTDAVLGMAHDGGWWALALRDPREGAALAGVPMSRPDTGELNSKALLRQGLSVGLGPPLRDVDTIADVGEVAALCPGGRFAAMAVSVTAALEQA
jgi:uncharacterized protein